MRRFVRWSILAVLVLVLLVVVGVQAVLWSDVPRRQVQGVLERQLGLDVAFDELSTGWLGGTTITGARFSLPLGDEPILEAPRLRVGHHNVVWLALSGKLGLSSVTVERPTVFVRERPGGGWNVQEAWDTFQARRRQGEAGGGTPRLPDLEVRGATVRVERGDGEAVVLPGMDVVGRRHGQLRYGVEVMAAGVGEARGAMLVGPPFTHEVTWTLEPAGAGGELLAELVPGAPAIAAGGEWRGEWGQGRLSGTLDLDRLTAGGHGAAGQAEVEFIAGERLLRLRPRALAVTVQGMPQPVTLAGGAAAYAWGGKLRLEGLRVEALETGLVLDGEADPLAQTGRVTGVWGGQAGPVTHRGRVRVDSAQGALGRRHVTLTATAEGQSPWGDWSSKLGVTAGGEAWTAMRGRLAVEELAVALEDRRFHVDGFAAAWSVSGSRFTVARAALPASALPRTLEVSGYFDAGERRWELDAAAAAFALPAAPFPLDRFTVSSRGTLDAAELRSFVLQSGPVQLSGRGAYAFGVTRQPLFLDVQLDKAPIDLGEQGEAARLAIDNLTGRLEVHGRLNPLNVEVAGDMLATALTVGDDPLGDIATRVTGTVEEDAVRFVASAPTWLGGQWRLEADWDRRASAGRFEILAEELDLSVADQLLGLPVDVTGIGGLRATIHAPAQVGGGRFDAVGTVTAVDAGIGFLTARVDADRVDAQVVLDDRQLIVRELRASREDAELSGSASIGLTGGGAAGEVRLEGWPILFGDEEAWIRVTGGLRGEQAPGGEPTATADLATAWRVLETDVGQLDVRASIRPQRLEVERLTGDILGGHVAGRGTIDLQAYLASDFAVEWQGIAMEQIRPFAGGVDLAGQVSGSLVFENATDPRALGPLKATLSIDAGQVRVQDLPFGQGRGVAYTDGERLVLENLEVAAAGGTLSLWGRLVPRPRPAAAGRPAEDEWVLYATAAAEGVDVATLSEALAPEGSPVVGRLDAEVTLSSPLGGWERAFGRGSITLSESDLGNVPIFGAIYGLANLQLGAMVPEGRGRSDFRVEEGVVYFPSFRYANRGFQLHFIGLRLGDFWAGSESPITGYATVGQSILPDTSFLGSINEAVQNLQADLIAARLRGTFGQPEAVPVPLQGFRELLAAPLGGE